MSNGIKNKKRTIFFWCVFAVTVLMFIITQYLLKLTDNMYFALSSIEFLLGALSLLDAKYALLPPKRHINQWKNFFFSIGKLHIYKRIVCIHLVFAYAIAILSGTWATIDMFV